MFDKAIQSPNDDILSAPLALAYALANGDKFSISLTKYNFFSVSLNGNPTATPAGETCLNEAAAGKFNEADNSLTNGHEFNASNKLI
ncbi:hypothetical protein WICMUC_000016 [Wickerhamomyces mucosus]|uniref:Uncharacterized protein n=1 Tax=Wickerhamomyces mucosus TaxID=1378264 RepID=A0A9P8TJJ8_9ASCO|nr:hypothetical protein WICMUC_000016 [Wickerhamomyces mucosus]